MGRHAFLVVVLLYILYKLVYLVILVVVLKPLDLLAFRGVIMAK